MNFHLSTIHSSGTTPLLPVLASQKKARELDMKVAMASER